MCEYEKTFLDHLCLLHSATEMKRKQLTLSEKSDILTNLYNGESMNEWCTALTGGDSDVESRHW